MEVICINLGAKLIGIMWVAVVIILAILYA